LTFFRELIFFSEWSFEEKELESYTSRITTNDRAIDRAHRQSRGVSATRLPSPDYGMAHDVELIDYH